MGLAIGPKNQALVTANPINPSYSLYNYVQPDSSRHDGFSPHQPVC
jgi:hypothetical protein